VDLRLKQVNAASRELLRAEAKLSALLQQRKQKADGSGAKRDELRRAIEQWGCSSPVYRRRPASLSRYADAHQGLSSGHSPPVMPVYRRRFTQGSSSRCSIANLSHAALKSLSVFALPDSIDVAKVRHEG
jgi:hypothetical protein